MGRTIIFVFGHNKTISNHILAKLKGLSTSFE